MDAAVRIENNRTVERRESAAGASGPRRAADLAGGSFEVEGSVVDDAGVDQAPIRECGAPGDRHRRGDGAREFQRSRGDIGCAEICLLARQNQRSRAVLRERARSADQTAKCVSIGPVEREHTVVDDVACEAAHRSAIADLERAGGNRRAAGMRARPGQDQRSGADLRERSCPADLAAKSVMVGPVERQRAVDDDVAGDVPRSRAIADLQHARGNRRAAGIGVRPAQDESPGADLRERARSADRAAIYEPVRTVEDECAIVDNIAGDAAHVPAIADLQRACRDRCAPAMKIVRSQDQGPGTHLRQSARPADHAAISHHIGAVRRC